MRTHLRKGTLALVAVGLLFVVGCSALPTQPKLDNLESAPAPESSIRRLDVTEPEGAPAGTPLSAPETPSQAVGATSSVRINGLFGGIVSAGKFKVVILPATFWGVATVTVSQPDVSKLQCDLDITPASANHFLVPVLFIADASSLPRELLAISTIQWWDPVRAKWVNVPGVSVSLLNLTVQAPLWHFSTYRVEGRAGW